VLLALLALPAGASPAAHATGPQPGGAKIVFTREFPKSVPDYFSITLAENGEATYATAPDDSEPVTFHLSETLARQFFQVAAQLNNFQGIDLETNRKVAFMGKKTLVYEADQKRSQVVFNHTENPTALALVAAFEKVGLTERHLLELERVMRFDRLGVYREVLQIEADMNRRDLVEPSQLLPLLEKLVADSRYMNVARERARLIIDRIQSGKYSPNIEWR
jgi:hypothetical protein